ncbi:MAG: anaerobic ribonucleoside-triphosphate reductase activating protein [Erysipelotrichaceae bacterium]|nr:anaerobic ribonucleoside-triphosphate reductase activating protein [Erysipelotrichaceae bacterium]
MMENKFIGLDSSILYRCNQKYFDKMLQGYGIGYTQFAFLVEIYENEGISMNELAVHGSFDKGTITKSIQKLEQLDYVRIENSESDKRSKLLYTSEKAREIMPQLYMLRQEWKEYLSSGLSEEEKEAYASAVDKMIEKAREYNLHEQDRSSVRIYGLQKLTLLDYPGKMAATVFTGGCNFRCPFCHNRSLVFLNENETEIGSDVILDYLEQRKNMLDGVCITGGEPLLHEGLEDFIRQIKEKGLLVKLDTNGSQSQKLKDLVEKGLVDYVAMDVKNSKDRYAMTIGLEQYDLSEVEKSVEYLKEGHVDYEFRTTVVKEFHEDTDFRQLGEWLRGAKNYYLQNFEEQETCIMRGLHPLKLEQLKDIEETLRPYVENIALRGVKE